MKKDHILTAFKGFGMGAANVIPGVSGGTIALLTGIYAPIIDAISAFTDKDTWESLLHGRFRAFWEKINGTFLLMLGLGVLVSVFSLAKLATWALNLYPILTWAFFFGLIAASSVIMFRDVKEWDLSAVLFTAAGIALGVMVCTLSPTQTRNDLWFIFVCGAVSICTMILPGISGSFVLLIMGKYDYIMQAVSELNWPVLIVFAFGCAVGILAFARLLRFLLSKWEKQTMLLLLGFVLGSLVKVWPWADMQKISEAQALREGVSVTGAALIHPVDMQIPWAIVWCIIGIALVVILELAGKKTKA